MTKKLFALFSATALIFIASRVLPAAECGSGGAPLEIINRSGSEIASISISRTGMEKWSHNYLKEPLRDGGTISVDIDRNDILGISDVKLKLKGGREIIWRRMPILEIFSVVVTDKIAPLYERIKLTS